ncbi:Mitochondrial ribosomal protein, S34 [Halocaridina rubra]|uniref:Mitochondrial ribosomal protein, S34 n=1 Tax=Halocaridina rubra TaxID=373956 RepID=A0AAN8XB86_HALRR
MPIIRIGRTHNHVGMRLWEIIGRLKNFGIGRMVVRSAFERYPEPTYYRILSARPLMDRGQPFKDEDNMKGHVLVERVFRGVNMGVVDLSRTAFKMDYKLVPKHEEYKYIQAAEESCPPEVKILPETMEMPPLLKILAERENHEYKRLKVSVKKTGTYRIAKEGETPTVELSLGLGTPASLQLYEGVLENK